MSGPTKRIGYLDMLRSLAIAGVVAIHSFDPVIAREPSLIFLTSLFRFAVPMYVLVSGALLLSCPEEPFKVFIKKRLLRLAVPLAVWSLIFGIWGSVGEPGFSWYDYLFRVVLFGQPFYLLFVLLGLYVITPTLKRWLVYVSRRELAGVVIGSLGLASVITMTENWLLAGSNILPHFSFSYFWLFLGFYLAGYFLSTVHHGDIKLPQITAGLIGSITFIGLSTSLLMARFGQSPKSFIWYDYLSLPVVCLSLCVFLFIKALNPKPLSLITTLSQASLGMYFIHMVLIAFLKSSLSPAPLFIVALCGSFGLTWLISKIPFLNRLLGCTA